MQARRGQEIANDPGNGQASRQYACESRKD
jgi:hypothetical protein